MPSKYAEDIQTLKTEVAVITSLLEERTKDSEKWYTRMDHKLDSIIANGKDMASKSYVDDAISTHSSTCSKNSAGSTLKDYWKVIAALVTIAGSLSTVLVYLITEVLPQIIGG